VPGAAPDRRSKRRKRALVFGLASVVVEIVAIWLRVGRPGGNVAVRCRAGHLYTTIWVPGVSVKSARMGVWRLQYCPVGRHWSIVSPVKESDLSWREKRLARRTEDIRVP
jgi:hypothetical protein